MDTSLTFASNRLLDTFREVERAGKNWLVVNGVPLVEGVLNGRFVPADEFGSFVNDWNDIPVVLPHPKKNGGSARVPDPDVPVVGRFYNARMDGSRLVGEYWLDKSLLESLRDNEQNQDAGQVLERIANSQEVETSTGYWSESVPKAGYFNGRDYSYVDQKIHPDHIALLTQEPGACSLADGCGLNRNSASSGTYEKRLDDIRQGFTDLMRVRDKRASELGSETAVPVESYVEETTDTHVFVRRGNDYFQVGYTYNPASGKVYFDDEPEWIPVIKDTRYVHKVAQNELAQNVTGSLPADGKKLWESVYQKSKEKYDEEKAAQIAWGAVKRAGWKEEDGKWVKANHGGPGPHKDGSSQDVHGGKGSGSKSASTSTTATVDIEAIRPGTLVKITSGEKFYVTGRHGNYFLTKKTRPTMKDIENPSLSNAIHESDISETLRVLDDFSWMKPLKRNKSTKQNQQDLEGLAVALLLLESVQ